MKTGVVTVHLPARLYAELQELAAEEGSEPTDVIARLVAQAQQRRTCAPEHDAVLDLVGAYRSDRPLIDDIPVSEDPDLYLVAEQLGERAAGRHAWDLAPGRYAQGPDGRPVRRTATR